jgi:hypothetical protein
MINQIRRQYERASDELEDEIECQRVSRYMGTDWRMHAAQVVRLRRTLAELRKRAALAGVDLDDLTAAYTDELADA